MKIFFILMLVITMALQVHGYQSEPPPDYTNPDYWQKLFNHPGSVDHPIVFIHGIAGGFDDWKTTIESISGGKHFSMRYNEDGILVSDYNGVTPLNRNWIWNASYYRDTPVREALGGDLTTYAERLVQILKTIRRISGNAEKVILITHSMGGLVARAAMIHDNQTWNSVHKLLTVASPHEGVRSSVGVVGQLKDLRRGSQFLSQLNTIWRTKLSKGYKQWGVIGAVDVNHHEFPESRKAGRLTDSAGIGFIELYSAIPFGEWSEAIGANFEQAAHNTAHFGYRIAIRGEHNEIMTFPATYRAILWTLRP